MWLCTVATLLGGLGGSGEIASAGSGQIRSYADALRKMLPEQNTDTLGTNADSRDACYQELERKFLDGSIAEHEFEELRKLGNISRQSEPTSGHTGKIAQADNIPAVANFGDNRYNEATRDLFRRYTFAIDSGELSPLADFELYKQVNNEVDNLLIGVVTSNGIVITGKSNHSVARVIGSVEQRRSGVSVNDVLRALTDKDSEVLPVRGFKSSRSQKFRSDKVEVSVNPDTGIIIQVNPAHSKRKVK